ncbi:MAG: flagellar basal body-associated FliL family protein [Spirochaetaceae bacterium]|jgi:flagellar FliL protein|nr:flagellar basal body-associated FliL family protein [Spirochaetaceae bacterium]
MADDQDVSLDEEGGEEGGAEGKKKKGGGNSLLPTLLKFVAIGLGAVVLIVTVAVITYNMLSSGGKSATVIPQTESYVAVKPEYSTFTLLDTVSTRTRDPTPYNVAVKMYIQYDQNDTASQTELTSRQWELRDFVRRYFAGKYAADLVPDNEIRIKNEIKELLNTTMLERARVRNILFDQLDVYSLE